jgi:hypothetical protein
VVAEGFTSKPSNSRRTKKEAGRQETRPPSPERVSRLPLLALVHKAPQLLHVHLELLQLLTIDGNLAPRGRGLAPLLTNAGGRSNVPHRLVDDLFDAIEVVFRVALLLSSHLLVLMLLGLLLLSRSLLLVLLGSRGAGHARLPLVVTLPLLLLRAHRVGGIVEGVQMRAELLEVTLHLVVQVRHAFPALADSSDRLAGTCLRVRTDQLVEVLLHRLIVLHPLLLLAGLLRALLLGPLLLGPLLLGPLGFTSGAARLILTSHLLVGTLQMLEVRLELLHFLARLTLQIVHVDLVQRLFGSLEVLSCRLVVSLLMLLHLLLLLLVLLLLARLGAGSQRHADERGSRHRRCPSLHVRFSS